MEGKIVNFHRPMDARQVGIEVVYQDLAIADNLTAADNVFLGRELKKGWGPFEMLDKKAMIARSAELFEELKSETRPRDLVRKMSGGQRQAVAIARTRLSDAKLVLMDEPTAAISVRQVAEVLSLIRRMKAQGRGDHADQPPHARRLRGLRPDRGRAPRHQGRRQGDGDDQPGGDHRPHHGSDPCRLTPPGRARPRSRTSPASPSAPLRQKVLASQPFWVTVALLVLAVAIGLYQPSFVTAQNIANITRNFAPFGIMALGMTCVIITGGIDLSVGSIMGLVAIVAGLFLTWEYPW